MARAHRDNDVGSESSSASSDKRALTDIEVAAHLGVSRFTVRSWRRKGTGPRFGLEQSSKTSLVKARK